MSVIDKWIADWEPYLMTEKCSAEPLNLQIGNYIFYNCHIVNDDNHSSTQELVFSFPYE